MSRAQLTGMAGVYLVAAELARRGLVASVTSRSAKGADIVAFDPSSYKTYLIQVKANARSFRHFIVGEIPQIAGLFCVLVNIKQNENEFFILKATRLANLMIKDEERGRGPTIVLCDDMMRYKNRWNAFGSYDSDR